MTAIRPMSAISGLFRAEGAAGSIAPSPNVFTATNGLEGLVPPSPKLHASPASPAIWGSAATSTSGLASLGARAKAFAFGLGYLWGSSAAKEVLRRSDSDTSVRSGGMLGSVLGHDAEEDEGQDSEGETAAEMLARIAFRDPANFDRQGALLDADEEALVWQWVPARHRIRRAVLAYSGAKHGYNLHTLYRLSEQVCACEGAMHGCAHVLVCARNSYCIVRGTLIMFTTDAVEVRAAGTM